MYGENSFFVFKKKYMYLRVIQSFQYFRNESALRQRRLSLKKIVSFKLGKKSDENFT